MKTITTFTLLLFSIILTSCDKEKVEIPEVDSKAIISPELYEKPDDFKTIIEAKIIGDVLEVTIGASGCDGNSWQAQLIDQGIVTYSLPGQRYAKIVLNNKEVCLAYFTRTFRFDLKPLRVNGDNKLRINLVGWDKLLLYVY